MPAVFVYFLIRASVRSLGHLKGWIYLLIALNAFLAANGILQYHTGIGLGNVGLVLDRIYGTGIFNDPNDLGMSFVMALPFVLLVIGVKGTPLVFRILAVVILPVILLATYYTNSRGAIVGLGAAMVCYSFLRFKKPSAVLVAAVLLAIISVAAPSRGSEMSFGESSAQTRIQSWAEGWAMLKSHPLTGVGFNQYTEYHSAVAHNSFVHTFAELGLAGAFCLVGMFYWYFKGLRLVPAANTDFLPWRRALLASTVGVLACGWFLSDSTCRCFIFCWRWVQVGRTCTSAEDRKSCNHSRRHRDHRCFDDLRSRARVSSFERWLYGWILRKAFSADPLGCRWRRPQRPLPGTPSRMR